MHDIAQRIAPEFRGKPLSCATGHGGNRDLFTSQVAATLQDALDIDAGTVPLHSYGSHVQVITPDGGTVDCGPMPDVSAKMPVPSKPIPSASPLP